MVIGTRKNIIEVLLKYTTQGIEKVNRASKQFNERISQHTSAIAKQGTAYFDTEKKINTLSQNIGENSQVIAQQQQLQRMGVKEARRVATHLKAENKEYSKQKEILTGNLGSINKEMTSNKKRESITKSVTDSQTNANTAQAGFSRVMGMNREQLGKFNSEGRKFNTLGGRMANSIRMVTHGAGGFRMEMLGVMFFGMMLYRVFGGLIKTSLEWLGVTEILTMALGILFLPVAERILEWALLFLNWVTQLTENQKKLIGTIVLLGMALGGALFILGTFALGIGSVILALGFLFTPLGLVIAGLVTLLTLTGVDIFWSDFGKGVDETKEKLVEFGVSAGLLEAVFEGMKNISGKIKNVLANMWSKGKEWFSENWGDMVLQGQEFLQKIFTGIRDNAPRIKNVLTKLIDNTASFISENFSSFIQFGLDILQTIIDGIENNLDIISGALEELVFAMITWVGQNTDKLLKIGTTIAGHIVQGMINGLVNAPVKALDKIFGTTTKGFNLSEVSKGIGTTPVQDFILQPGGKLIKTDSRDTIMGSKSGFGGGVSITYNITGVSSPQDIKNMLEENNRQLTEDVRRSVGG